MKVIVFVQKIHYGEDPPPVTVNFYIPIAPALVPIQLAAAPAALTAVGLAAVAVSLVAPNVDVEEPKTPERPQNFTQDDRLTNDDLSQTEELPNLFQVPLIPSFR